MVTSMLSVDPQGRLSCAEYLNNYRESAFPDVFFRIHPFLADINEITAPPYNGESSTGPPAKTGSDEKLERLWIDLDLVASFLSKPATSSSSPMPSLSLFPLQLNVPAFAETLSRKTTVNEDDPAALLLITLICANIRNCSQPSSIVRALDLLLALSAYLSDDTRLDRLLPYMVAVVDDGSALVRAAAVRSITQLVRGPLASLCSMNEDSRAAPAR